MGIGWWRSAFIRLWMERQRAKRAAMLRGVPLAACPGTAIRRAWQRGFATGAQNGCATRDGTLPKRAIWPCVGKRDRHELSSEGIGGRAGTRRSLTRRGSRHSRSPSLSRLRVNFGCEQTPTAVTIQGIRPKLIVLDPISACFTINLANDQAVRWAIQPLAELVERHGVAVVLVRLLTSREAEIRLIAAPAASG